MLIVAGLPASGKSTFARKYGKHILEFDDVAKHFGVYTGIKEIKELAIRQFALLASTGKYDTIVDVFQSKESRAYILKFCPKAHIVVINTPLEICLRRNEKRQYKWLNNDELVSIAMQFESVSKDEGFSSIKIFDNSKENPMEKDKIWLKIINGEIQAFGDKETLDKLAGGTFDMELTADEWESCGCDARLENGKIVLGTPEEVLFERNAEIIRNERYLKLRQCDKMSPMHWKALTKEQQDAWIQYRIDLLNIPQQKGFPWDGDIDKVPWPVQPK